jgi:hypothetical protein
MFAIKLENHRDTTLHVRIEFKLIRKQNHDDSNPTTHKLNVRILYLVTLQIFS